MALRTPEQYLESLRDGRRVYMNGQRIEDVTSAPVFKEAALHLALSFRMSHDPEARHHVLATCPETGTVVEIDFPELLRRERRFIHSAHAFLQSVAIPYFRAMENDVMSRKLVAWTDIYVDYKMRESRYTVADEMRPGCPLRNIRLQAIGGLFKCLGFSFSTEDITAKDVFIIPGLPVEGGVTVRTGQKEEPD